METWKITYTADLANYSGGGSFLDSGSDQGHERHRLRDCEQLAIGLALWVRS